jgi:excisionase family DNA binding protein
MAITMTMKDAAKASGLSVRMLYELITAGKLKSVKVGRRRLVIVKSLTELVTKGA